VAKAHRRSSGRQFAGAACWRALRALRQRLTEIDAIRPGPSRKGSRVYKNARNGIQIRGRNRLAGRQPSREQVMRAPSFATTHPRWGGRGRDALIRDGLPGFAAENRLTVLSQIGFARIWRATRARTPTHMDEWPNIGCRGGRPGGRFHAVPPEQIANFEIRDHRLRRQPARREVKTGFAARAGPSRSFPRFRGARRHGSDGGDGCRRCGLYAPLWGGIRESLEPFNMR